jgi:hypothetical protein
MVALPLGLPPLGVAARVQQECHRLHGDTRAPGGSRKRRRCHAQVGEADGTVRGHAVWLAVSRCCAGASMAMCRHPAGYMTPSPDAKSP